MKHAPRLDVYMEHTGRLDSALASGNCKSWPSCIIPGGTERQGQNASPLFTWLLKHKRPARQDPLAEVLCIM